MSHEYNNYREAWANASAGWGSYLEEAEKDLRLFLGDQWDPKLKRYLKDQGRSTAVYNKSKRIVNFITGYERRNRLSLNVKPRGNSDDSLANQQSAILLQVMSNYGGYEVCSEAFKMATCITGLNLIETYIDHNGNIAFNRDAYNQVLVDPMFTKTDLSDCAYIIRERSITKDKAKLFFPGREEEIEQLNEGSTSNLFSRATHNSLSFNNKTIVYGEYHRQTLRNAVHIVDRQTGNEKKFDGTEDELTYIATQLEEQFAITEKLVPDIRVQVFLQDQMFYDGPDKYGMDEYRFVPIMGDYVPEMPDSKYKLQGIIRSIRDPQIEFNKRMSQETDMLESQVATGFIAEQGQVVDSKSLYGTGQGKVIWVKNREDGNPSGTAAVQRIQPPDISPGMDNLGRKTGDLIDILTGTNEELLGSDNKDIPGVLSRMRTGAALTTLQTYFDAYRTAKGHLGKLIIKMVQRNYSPQKIEQLLEEQVHPNFYGSEILDNDITVQEGIHTDSQREAAYMELKALKESGVQGIPDSFLLELMPVHMKDGLKEHIQQQEQARQQQAAEQAQLEKQQIAVNTQLVQSETAKNMAKVREMDSEVLENEANAILDRAKAIVEIEKTQLDIEDVLSLRSPRKPRTKKRKK